MSAPARAPGRPVVDTAAPNAARLRGWKVRASVVEGLISVRSSVLAPVVVAITALVLGGALLTDALVAGRVLRAEAAYLAAGGDLLVAQDQAGRPLDAAACGAVTGLTGVRAVAAVSVLPGAARVAGRPDSAQTVVLATAGVLDVLGAPDLDAGDVLVSRTIAERWQWSAGAHLRLLPISGARVPSTVLTVRAVADLGLLSEGASTGVLVVRSPGGDADACFVRIEPQYRADLRDALPVVLGSTSRSTVTVADRLPAGAAAVDPAVAFDTRATRWAGPAAGVFVGLLWGVVAWTRRGRSALYASLGVPYSGGVLLRWTEGSAVVLLGGLWGTALATTVGVVLLRAPVDATVSLCLRGGAAGVAVAVALVVLVGLWRPPTLAALKDR